MAGPCRSHDPRPDHGEAGYHGIGRLNWRTALIAEGRCGNRSCCRNRLRSRGRRCGDRLPAFGGTQRTRDGRIICAAGSKVVPLPGDIREDAFCQSLVQQAVSGFDGLDVIIGNTGRQQSRDSILDISMDQFDWTVRTNLYAKFRITRAAIPHTPPGSAIIFTGSVNAFDPATNLLDYLMTKAAIANFSKGLVRQRVKRGGLNVVAPGP